MRLIYCALHYLLLNYDGLDKNWDQGVRSNKENYNSLNPGNNYNLQIAFLIAYTQLGEDEVNKTTVD